MRAQLDPQARYCAPPSFASLPGRKATAAQRLGIRYEATFLDHLTRWAPGNGYELKAKPWIAYSDVTGRTRYCQPDCLLFSKHDDNLLVVEVKIRHTRDAFKQLYCYRDHARALHPDRTISLVEVCRYFDRDEMPVELLQSLRPHDYKGGAAVVWDPRYEGFNA